MMPDEIQRFYHNASGGLKTLRIGKKLDFPATEGFLKSYGIVPKIGQEEPKYAD